MLLFVPLRSLTHTKVGISSGLYFVLDIGTSYQLELSWPLQKQMGTTRASSLAPKTA